ncbi:two-component sensor histidine kinase [Paenibacillus amylolyticus]|uniref:histidine kinase n=1 Tax=Paenibacillus amylolyticus TaxID=1451 RepID=A0A1R1BL18_PAEAM|nr:sensor histidine kinase [Paenibacillus amylolyticus]OMF09145.1 two-component sensor histidine kinase [Paenibacillus amylolyticus]
MTLIFAITTGILAIAFIVLWLKFRKRSQHLTYIHEKISAILDQGTFERLLVFNSDDQVSQLLKDMNQLLDHAHRATAGYANQEKEMRNMLSNISHDLKTPLTVVLGYSETLLHSPSLTDQERKIMTEKIQDKAQEVLRLIHSFFDLAKLESGDTELVLSRVNISELCRLKMISFYEMLTNLGLHVQLDIPDDDIFVQGNEESLDRVLDNLMTNGMKYGAEGKVLGLSLEHSAGGPVTLQIWDQGKGIPESEHSRVFERMYTLEDSRNRLYQGSGLGLTITKRLVERMGGSIHLHSVPHQRTVFSVTLKAR